MGTISFNKYQYGDEANVQLALYNSTSSLFSFSEDTYTIRDDAQIIGFIDFGYFQQGELHINVIEIIHKNMGYGTIIIDEIKKCNQVLTISVNPSSEKSKKFWEKNGFIQETDEDWCWHR